MKKTLALCLLTLLCGCSQPAPPAASGTPVAATPVTQDFSTLTGKTVKDFTIAPFGGLSKDLSTLVGAKLEAGKGAYVPFIEPSSGNKFVVAFIPGADPAEVDSRAAGPLKVSGQFKSIEDGALAKSLEGKLGGSLFQQDGKPVYLLLDSDPWPAPKGTP
ncbi:MAG: hypothetical protein KF760_31590 [Candidatus Eremiobacteraeota bacterium]|nr:hypothetical protein [Candidatus Eremiobacteraeota bacterium]MCW5870040.1 hypothetical protein [Candidatus Eremiobacteraeota bacterium]